MRTSEKAFGESMPRYRPTGEEDMMKKRILAGLLCLCMLCSLVPAVALAEEIKPEQPETPVPQEGKAEPQTEPVEKVTEGDLGTVHWIFDKSEGLLILSGKGEIGAFTETDKGWSVWADSIEKVKIISGPTTLKTEAFAGCSRITRIQIPGTLTTLEKDVFKDCAGNVKLFIEAEKESWKEYSNAYLGLSENALVCFKHYDPENHKDAMTQTTVEATCSKGSHIHYACPCGWEEDGPENDDKKAHTPVKLPAKEPNCTENGLTEGEECSVCHTILKPQAILAKVPDKHVKESVPAKAPTETEYGHTAGVQCKLCGKVISGLESILPTKYTDGGKVGDMEWTWIESSGTLTITGKGAVDKTPWRDSKHKILDKVKTVVVGEGITSLPVNAFAGGSKLTSVKLPATLTGISASAFYKCSALKSIDLPESITSIDSNAFYGCSALTEIKLPASIKEIGSSVFSGCKALKSVNLPNGLKSIGESAFYGCKALTSVTLPKSLTELSKGVFAECTGLTSAYVNSALLRIREDTFKGAKYLKRLTLHAQNAIIMENAFSGCARLDTIYYYGMETQWKDTVIGLGNEALSKAAFTYMYKETAANRVTLDLAGTGLKGTTVWIDGVACSGKDTVDTSKSGQVSIQLADGKAKTAVIYTFMNPGAKDVHTTYPTGMYVWMLSQEDGMYVSLRLKEFDNILQYGGASIRITGNKGIRLITGIPKGIKTELISKSGYMGYTLEETGTIVAWDSEMGDKDLVLGASYTKKGTAYSKANKKDPVFKKTGSGLLQYTNSLVGYTDAQCEPDLAMRPYMILKNAAGETVTLYGGTVHRSIGYIAYQNRNAFKPGSAAYEYIWGIIRAAYGNTYDAEYKKN